jgi:uncharacterized protein YegP (UPF0339 family)
MIFELFTRRVGLLRRRRFFFRMVARNGKTVAQSEGYQRAIDRMDTVLLIKRTVAIARIVDLGEVAP